METKALVYRSWEELVFENRNKHYGAYVLRRSYNDKVLLGLGISVVFLAILLALPKSTLNKIKIIPEVGPPIVWIQPPVIERTPPLPPRAASRQTGRANTPPIVTRDLADESTLIEEPVSLADDVNIDTGGGSIVGTGVEIPVEVPVPSIDFTKEFINPGTPPVYEGGYEAMMNFIQRKMRYPNVPRRMGIEGTVFVSFLVNGDGSVGDVNVLRGIHPDCDKEAVRVISMLQGWIGGKHGGVPVKVRMVLPIKFKLN
jgi:protein TonB